MHSKTGRNYVTAMTSNDSSRNINTDFGSTSATRKVRTRATQRQIKRRQNIILGTIVVVITLTFVAIGIINNFNVDYYHKRMIRAETTIDYKNDRDKNLRGGDEERDIWVSQESQPFVSVA